MVGKISQAAILAAAAYRNHETFKRQTGITKSRLIYDKEHHDTKVGLMSPNWSPGLLQQQSVWLALFSSFLLSLVFLCPFASVQVHIEWLTAQQSLMSLVGSDRRVCRQGLCGVQVHVGWLEGGTAVFAFRGTASKQDGLQDVKIFSRNIDYLQELYPGVKAHLGTGNKLAELSIKWQTAKGVRHTWTLVSGYSGIIPC